MGQRSAGNARATAIAQHSGYIIDGVIKLQGTHVSD
jgi:hypothetical protein